MTGENHHSEAGEAVEDIAQRICGFPTPEDRLDGALGPNLMPDLVVVNPAHSKALGLDDLYGPFQPKSFHHFMIPSIT